MPDLPTRTIAGRAVSAVSLGCMNLSHGYGTPPDEADAVRLLNRALDLGVTHLDTAALYGGGRNETLLGRSVMHRRHEFQLASKCALEQRNGVRTLDGTPDAVARTLEDSLRRLGVEHIDLYYIHRLDRTVPIEDTVGTLVRAKEAGKIGAIGLSEMGADTIRRAHAVHPIAAVQSELSPTVRNPEIAVLEACAALGIAFVAFSPLGHGLLAGSLRDDDYQPGDVRLHMPRLRSPHIAGNVALADRFAALAAEAGCTPAQLSLAWVLARGPHVVPIPGTTRIDHLEENLAAATLTVDPGLVDRVTALFPPGAASGPRYSAPLQAQADTETFADEALA